MVTVALPRASPAETPSSLCQQGHWPASAPVCLGQAPPLTVKPRAMVRHLVPPAWHSLRNALRPPLLWAAVDHGMCILVTLELGAGVSWALENLLIIQFGCATAGFHPLPGGSRAHALPSDHFLIPKSKIQTPTNVSDVCSNGLWLTVHLSSLHGVMPHFRHQDSSS